MRTEAISAEGVRIVERRRARCLPGGVAPEIPGARSDRTSGKGGERMTSALVIQALATFLALVLIERLTR